MCAELPLWLQWKHGCTHAFIHRTCYTYLLCFGSCSDHFFSFSALGVSACQPPNGMQVYAPQAIGMNSTQLKFLGGGGGGRCLSIPSASLLPVTSMPQSPLAGAIALQDPLMQGHSDHHSQQQDTSLTCDTPTPPPSVMYSSGTCNSWPPLCNTGLQPLPHTKSYSEEVSPVSQSTGAAVDLPGLGEDVEGASSDMQSPSSKGSCMSSMEKRGGPCTPLCLATSQPSSEPALNEDTPVTAPHQQRDSPHSAALGNQVLAAASATLPTFSHMAPLPQFPMNSTAGIPRNVNSSLHPVYFTNFQFVAGGSDRVKGDTLPSAGCGPYASSDLQPLPTHSSEEHFPPMGGSLQSGLVSQSNSLGTVDLHPWSLASCKQRVLSPGTEDECELNSSSCTAEGAEPPEKQPRLSYQNSSVSVPSNGCLWTPLYVTNYHSQLQQYNHHSSLPAHNSIHSPVHQQQPQSCVLTSTSDYPLQTEPSVQPPTLCNLQMDKSASHPMQGMGSVQSQPSTTGSDPGHHSSNTPQLSPWALHMSKGMDAGPRLQMMPFGLLPAYNGLGSVGASTHNC